MAFLKEHSIFKRDIYEKHVFHSSPRRLAGEKKCASYNHKTTIWVSH